MAYLGNTPTTQSFSPAIDYFSGNGSTTSFTLSRAVAAVAQVQVVIENVPQNPTDAFTVSGSTITFTSAPPSGTNNIYVYYTSPITQLIQPGYGTVGQEQLKSDALTPAAISDKANTSTGSLSIPVGTTAQRPASPAAGMVRYNTTLNQFEVYQNGSWTQYMYTYSVDYLVIAGGGGAGGGQGGVNTPGGGGAGGMQQATGFNVTAGTSFSVTIGAGGSGGAPQANGSNGANSSFANLTSIGGGGGGGLNGGLSGGSGGGAGGNGNIDSGGAGTSGQGYAGGANGNIWGGGGGGGAGGAGSGAANGDLIAGIGLASAISGTTTLYAVGGAGAAGAGTANTGNGGNIVGGSTGNAGGSGLVVVRYLGAQRGTGGTVTSSGGYTYHTFTSSGTYTA